jgi:adenosylcobinamide kinase/adenosylcobinamide-phosphate guanylyltransferase
MKKTTLVLGGIRSGKSFFAEQRALYYSDRPVYIATAIPFDDETRARIHLHRERRQNRFEVYEEPIDITTILSKHRDRVVLVDCMTLNLSNRLLQRGDEVSLDQMITEDDQYLEEIRRIIDANRLNVIFVSNEVGLAPVEPNRLGRYFQDLQGRWNRIMGQQAADVYMIQAGIANLLKKESNFPFKLSAPSYLYPGGYIENVTRVIDRVDDIQLLLFDSSADDPLFEQGMLSTLYYLQTGAGITYSAHMPVRPRLTEDFDTRLKSSLDIIQAFQELDMSSYTFHYDLPEGQEWETMTEAEIREMNDTYTRFFNSIRRRFPAIDISLENTATPLSALDIVVNNSGISYCIDIGHLIIQNRDLEEIGARLGQTSVIHLHGVQQVKGKLKDHQPLDYNRRVFQLLEQFNGVLTIENYHPSLFAQSRSQLEHYF